MKMSGFQGFIVALYIISATASLAGKWMVVAELHHVVGEDRGWDPSSDLSSWSSSRIFRVGDKIWFTYSAAHGLLTELKSKEEYESCDVSNPIRMYTDGLHTIPLEREGIRYFVSSEPEHCKNGLKLHVNVQPMTTSDNVNGHSIPKVAAEAPSTPSGSTRYGGSSVLMLVAMFCAAAAMVLAY